MPRDEQVLKLYIFVLELFFSEGFSQPYSCNHEHLPTLPQAVMWLFFCVTITYIYLVKGLSTTNPLLSQGHVCTPLHWKEEPLPCRSFFGGLAYMKNPNLERWVLLRWWEFIFLMPSSGKLVSSHFLSHAIYISFLPWKIHFPSDEKQSSFSFLSQHHRSCPSSPFPLVQFPNSLSLSYMFGPPPSPLPHSPLGSPFRLYSRAPLFQPPSPSLCVSRTLIARFSSVLFCFSFCSCFLFRSSRVAGFPSRWASKGLASCHIYGKLIYVSVISQLYFLVSCRYYWWRYGNVNELKDWFLCLGYWRRIYKIFTRALRNHCFRFEAWSAKFSSEG